MAPRFATASILAISLVGATHAGENDKEILEAIKKGQTYLKNPQPGAPLAGMPATLLAGIGGNGKGTTCLIGLALIESGLDAKDKTVAAIARDIRESALTTAATYEISLTIMFLDRLGQKEDEGLIQFLTLRLMSGQNKTGGWSYLCGLQLDPVETRQISAELLRQPKLTTPDAPPPPPKGRRPREDIDAGPKQPKKDKPSPDKESTKPDSKPKLHPALEKYARAIKNGTARASRSPFSLEGACDHSNTQFATVGLWCGRRHGVDVSDALAALDKHYRDCQNTDGGWTYSSGGGDSSPQMTCAGLMGLAMGFAKGSGEIKTPNADAIAADKVLANALKYVGSALADAKAQPGPGAGGPNPFAPQGLHNNLYFMWSLERVGMVYGLKTIGNVDWYEWGSRLLIKSQDANGSWRGDGTHGVSTEHATAFAILFLSRANLAQDLATSLKSKIRDPGTSHLRSPGDAGKVLEGAGKGSSGPTAGSKGTTLPKPENPPAVAETDKAGKLAAALIAADAARRAELLVQYRDTRGGEHTDALARAAAKMTGEPQAQVRQALAQRLTRMTSATLNEMMRDRDRELRRGAALAVAAKGKERLKEFAPMLIRLVADDEAIVSQAARSTLKALSGEDFGPEAGAGATERGQAVVNWRTWWEKQKQ